jgi:pyruvate/2-oxoglutarate dehydrogenase complex dihydrolipoamide acyltransferase (E2) component
VQAGEVVPVGTVLVVIGADGTSVPSNSLLQEKEGAGNAPEQSTREPRNRLLQGGQGARDAARAEARAGARRRLRHGHRRSSACTASRIARSCATVDHRVIDGKRAADFGLAVIARLQGG